MDFIGISKWREPNEQSKKLSTAVRHSPNHADEIDAAALLHEYERRTHMRSRFLRFMPAALIYAAFGVLLFVVLGFPMRPSRGSWAKYSDIAALALSVAAFVILLFLVVDATRLCARVTELLTQARTNWGTALDKYQSKRGVPAAYLDEWIDIDFISQASKPVVRLIYYPFFVLTIMILSRNHYFDSWDWPPALLLILGCSSVYAVYCALRLRGAAERARTQCLTTLHEKLSRVLADKGEPDARLNIMASNETAPATVSHPKGLADQLRMMIEQIEQTEQGAFAPVARHPVVAAVFMPFGGAGILALLEYLATH